MIMKSHCVMCGAQLLAVRQRTLDGGGEADIMCPVCTECKVRLQRGDILFVFDSISGGSWITCHEEDYQRVRKEVEAKKTRSGRSMGLCLPSRPPRSRVMLLDQKTFNAVAYARLSGDERCDASRLEELIEQQEEEVEGLEEELSRAEFKLEQLRLDLDVMLGKTQVAIPKGSKSNASKAESA